MNRNMIESAKKQYEELIQVRDQMSSIKEYLHNKGYSKEKIKRYLVEVEKELISEENIIRQAFYNVEDDYSECNIYVFRGAYRRRNEQYDSLVENYKRADYFLYQNLEKRLSLVIVNPQEQKQFEEDNIVLRFDDNICISKKIEKLQYIYFSEYLNNPDISQERILKKLRENLE